MRNRALRPNRSGNIIVLSAVLMVAMFALVACAVDLGYILVVDTELQRTADAAATAACWELFEGRAADANLDIDTILVNTRETAAEFSSLNRVTNEAMLLAAPDVQIGQLVDPSDPSAVMTFDTPSRFNAVTVRVQKTEAQNGPVPLFFGRVFTERTVEAQAAATAAFLDNIVGFQPPSSGENVQIMPFAIDEETWNGLETSNTDNWTWNEELQQIAGGADGKREVNLYPQGTGAPGNRGTIDIGGTNNSTKDIARQLLGGISQADFDEHGGTLQLDASGQLLLNGDTGISAGVKEELAIVMGEPKILPVFRYVSGSGNTAQYAIVGFVGARIMEVDISGKMSSKRVMVQEARVVVRGGIPGDGTSTSQNIFSPVWIVR